MSSDTQRPHRLRGSSSEEEVSECDCERKLLDPEEGKLFKTEKLKCHENQDPDGQALGV